ncbi:NusG domain II-containing protein [Dendrosporobacter sp. 1207_IL3150]|uniref:NusG domain II-containing protein n=1 Tax=Dendrosporobacter sp. 1207_IL3150 TaxID=3084054 RepID=UPI002FD89B9A
MLTKGDKYLVFTLIIISVLGIYLSFGTFSTSANTSVQVTYNGKEIKNVPLKKGHHEEFIINGLKYYDVIEINDGRVRVREANCPDKICIHSGWISNPHQQIVCLPNKLVIKILSGKSLEIDDIAR